ncbi:MAG: protein-disulfide reductase DsbD domain-containing protein, partial [Chitinophagales bacterium]
MRNLLLYIISSIFISINILAQNDGLIQWNFHTKELGNNEFILTFDAQIQEGWYLYSQHLDGQTPRPTKIEFEEMTEGYIKLSEIEEQGEIIEYYDTAIEKDIRKYADRVKFVTTVRTFSDKVDIAGTVDFMICNNTECKPPTKQGFVFKLLAPPNKPTLSVNNNKDNFEIITDKKYTEEGFRSNDGKMLGSSHSGTVLVTKNGIESVPKPVLPEYQGGMDMKNEEKTVSVEGSNDLIAHNMGAYMVRETTPVKKKK